MLTVLIAIESLCFYKGHKYLDRHIVDLLEVGAVEVDCILWNTVSETDEFCNRFLVTSKILSHIPLKITSVVVLDGLMLQFGLNLFVGELIEKAHLYVELGRFY